MLTVFIDFKSPASYLAIDPILALSQRLSLPVIWRPFRTRLEPVPDKLSDETVAQSHRRVRAAARRAVHIHYARLRGIDLNFPAAPGETDLALGVLAQLDTNPIAFIRAGFASFWNDHLDLDNETVVGALVDADGSIDHALLTTAREALEKAQADAEDIGIVDAPAFLIKDQIFIGREHLPWIAEIAQSA